MRSEPDMSPVEALRLLLWDTQTLQLGIWAVTLIEPRDSSQMSLQWVLKCGPLACLTHFPALLRKVY